MMVVPLQLGYLLLAVGYNLLSMGFAKRDGRPLAPTNARAALTLFAVYAFVIVMGVLDWALVYRVGMGVFAVLLTMTGIVAHLARGPDETYRSTYSWIGAIVINVGGVLVTSAGVVLGPEG